jgi:hypothetical protein
LHLVFTEKRKPVPRAQGGPKGGKQGGRPASKEEQLRQAEARQERFKELEATSEGKVRGWGPTIVS